MLKIPYDAYNEIDSESKKIIHGKNKRRRFCSTVRYPFAIRYNDKEPKGYRYRVIAGCRDFNIMEACNHWLSKEHHSYKKRTKTLRKLFKLYKVEKRRIPKVFRERLGY